MTNVPVRLNVRPTIAILCVFGIISGTALLPRSANAAALLRTALSLIAGENPSLANCDPVLGTCAVGDARLIDGPVVRVTVENLDPSRFPAGPVCNGEVTAGAAIAAKGVQLVGAIAADGSAVTTLDIRQPGTVNVGDDVRVRIRCEFTNALGVRERHETQWAGKF